MPERRAARASLAACMCLMLAAVMLAVVADARAQLLRPWTGGATPPLALRDLDGRTHRLDDYAGQVVLVNFWATWCAPCRAEMPSIEALGRSLKGEPFSVLAVNVGEDDAAIRAFVRTVPVTFALLLDRDSRAARAWRARALPATYIIGPGGEIRFAHVGLLDWSSEPVRGTIRALMPGAASSTTALAR